MPRIAIRVELVTVVLVASSMATLATLPVSLTSWQPYALIANTIFLCLHHYAMGRMRGALDMRDAIEEFSKKLKSLNTTGQDGEAGSGQQP